MGLRQTLNRMSDRWLENRVPSSSTVQLNRKNVFIFPGLFGGFYLAMTVCLFVLAVNYQNNLLLFLSQCLLSLFLIALFTAYKNFARLTVSAQTPSAVHAGETAYLNLKTTSATQPLTGILEVGLRNHKHTSYLNFDAGESKLALPVTTVARGKRRLPRVTLRSAYPLGIVRCWTHLDFGQDLWVYPKPKATDHGALEHTESDGEAVSTTSGNDDFFALQPFQSGDPLNKVAWKKVAKGGEWSSKVFVRQHASITWLDINTLNLDTELSLSILCWQVNRLTERNHTFGLKLGDVIIPPSSGSTHQQTCLQALTLFPKGASQ